MTTEPKILTHEQVDELLEGVLRASGSRLGNYHMQKTLDDIRSATRAIEQAVLQSPEIQRLREDFNESMALLNTLFGLWECGHACYDRPGDGATYIGNAFRLDDETFRKCVDMLNRGRQNDAAMEKQP